MRSRAFALIALVAATAFTASSAPRRARAEAGLVDSAVDATFEDVVHDGDSTDVAPDDVASTDATDAGSFTEDVMPAETGTDVVLPRDVASGADDFGPLVAGGGACACGVAGAPTLPRGGNAGLFALLVVIAALRHRRFAASRHKPA